MKSLLSSALVAVALTQPLEISDKDLGEWESFKVRHMMEYETAEEAKRMKIFVDHLKFIREHNAKYDWKGDIQSWSQQVHRYGIYGPPSCSTELDHGVLVIGYGTQSGSNYWLVKNSWGTDWGISGYFMLAKNKHNMCGVATEASYPIN